MKRVDKKSFGFREGRDRTERQGSLQSGDGVILGDGKECGDLDKTKCKRILQMEKYYQASMK